MSVKVNLHSTLRQFTNGLEAVETKGNTVGDCLNDLASSYPGIGKFLFSKNGKLSNTIEIYLNLESAYPDELAKPVRDGDQIHIVMMLSGG